MYSHRRRQTFAEEAYLDLYRSLANAPDLNGALTSAAEDLRKAQASEAELPGLKEQLAHFEVRNPVPLVMRVLFEGQLGAPLRETSSQQALM